ncbi:MAG: type II toxin-antitoxin system ParD family antitoxin [Elainellaceae cyanobacterium]
MYITPPPELEQLIQRQLANGKYQSAIEVISAAIHLLDQQDDIYQGRLNELRQDIQLGWDAVQRGEVVEGTAAMAQIRASQNR